MHNSDRLLYYLFSTSLILNIFLTSCSIQKIHNKHTENSTGQVNPLKVPETNPHLFEDEEGKPVFLNNYTVWEILGNGSREDIAEFIAFCRSQKFNMISAVILNDGYNGSKHYGTPAFKTDSNGDPDPLQPVTTPGNDPGNAREYDYWDHVEYLIDITGDNGMYISLHPTWGGWVSGGYNGPSKNDHIIFNEDNAYKYGNWLGKRFRKKKNIIWMLGGDRSAVYTKDDTVYDFRPVWNAMAEGIADGKNGIFTHDNKADFSKTIMSYHPRKWAPNSSEWFHNEAWLTFNSIQDTPYDQVKSIIHDYDLKPIKPVWLFEGRYEGATSDWAVRYQAYQTVFSGGFGVTYGSDNCAFPGNWKELIKLPGAKQMGYLYHITREIWTDKEFSDRTPGQSLIVNDIGKTVGDGMTIGVEELASGKKSKHKAYSDRITALKSKDGEWAMIYLANGRDVTIDLSKLQKTKMNACWFNPRTGKWHADNKEYADQKPFMSDINTGHDTITFNPPGDPLPHNDWVLILKKSNSNLILDTTH